MGITISPSQSPCISLQQFLMPRSICWKKISESALSREGLQELMTCDLISPAASGDGVRKCDEQRGIDLSHALSFCRPVRLEDDASAGPFANGKYNFDHGNPNIAGFEVGRVHFKDKDQYFEPSTAGDHSEREKRPPTIGILNRADFDFFDLKGISKICLAGFKIEGLEFEISHLHNFHPGRQAKIKKGTPSLGVMGEVHPGLMSRKIDVPQRIFFAEINLNELMPLIPKQWKVADLAQFPGSERDWTVTLNDDLPIEAILNALRSVPSRLLEKVMLLDLYKSEQIGKDKKNATFRFFYRDMEKTIAFETVEREHARITSAAAEKLNHRGV